MVHVFAALKLSIVTLADGDDAAVSGAVLVTREEVVKHIRATNMRPKMPRTKRMQTIECDAGVSVLSVSPLLVLVSCLCTKLISAIEKST